jgi:formate-dependent nitrite reductase membrane component NrfD
VSLLHLARTVYDVGHPERAWGWKVSTYLWTKSIAAGALLVAALSVMAGGATDRALAGIAAALVALVFLALTTGLLVWDLKRPERFLYLLFKPNWRSWLVWGGWILVAFGAAATLWLLIALAGDLRSLELLAWIVVGLAGAAAGYSAFLFGQAEGRDFWQSPVVLPHLLAAALAAGSAALLLVAAVIGAETAVSGSLRVVLLGSLGAGALLLAAELSAFHPTHDAARAARTLTHGSFSGRFWAGVVGGGLAAPALLLLVPWPGAWSLAAVLALAGLWLWEDLWVRAGQTIPLS